MNYSLKVWVAGIAVLAVLAGCIMYNSLHKERRLAKFEQRCVSMIKGKAERKGSRVDCMIAGKSVRFKQV